MDIEAYHDALNQSIKLLRESYFTDEELEKYLLWRKFQDAYDAEKRISNAIFEKYLSQEN